MELKSHTTPSNLMSHQPSSHALYARHTHQPSSLTTLSCSNQGGIATLSSNPVGIAASSPANQQSEIIKELMKKQMHHKHKRSELPASLPQFKFEKHIKLPVGGFTQSGVYQQSLNPQLSSTSLVKDQNYTQATPNSQNTNALESPQQLQNLGSSAKLIQGGGPNSGNAKRVTFEPQLEEPSDSTDQQQDEQSQSDNRKQSSDEHMISYVREEFSAAERAEAEGIVESLNHHQRDQASSSQPRSSGSHHRRQRVYINGSMIPQNYDLNPGSFYQQPSQLVCKNQEISDRESRGNDEEDTLNGEDAPTVVIDDSAESELATLEDRFRKLDDQPIMPNEYGVLPCPQSSSGGIRESKQSVQPHAHDNIQAALLSIRKQEQEERVGIREEKDQNLGDDLMVKKPVAVMSAEEEEALIFHINEIRDRIRRGETAAQQQQRLKEFSGDRSSHYRMQSQQLQIIPDEDEDSNYQQEILNEYGGVANTDINREQFTQAPIKPPLYASSNDKGRDQGSESNTYDSKNTQNRLEEFRVVSNSGASNMKQRSFHSIDTSNIPGAQLKCLIMTDEPNIYEKKRQRFERIQRMRNGTDSSSREPPSQEYGASLKKGSDQAFYQYDNSSLKVLTSSNLMRKAPVQQQVMLSSLDSVRTRQQQDQSITKSKKSGGKTKSISQKIIQKTAGAQRVAQLQPNQVKRGGAGKSRQLSTADQLQLILTSQSQQYQHNNPSQIAIYNTSLKSAQQGNPQKKENTRSKSTSRSGSKDKPRGNGVGAAYSHKTLDQDTNNVLQDALAHQIISNTYRPPPTRQSGIGLSSGGYDDDEELQIQLFSMKKVIQNGPQGQLIVQSTSEKQRPSARPQTTSSILKKKNLSKSRKGTHSIYVPTHQATNQGSIVVPSIQYPGTVIHHKQQKSMSNHVKNNKSNLMINLDGPQQQQPPHVTQAGMPMMNPGLAHSLSLKRLKTPKMKQKEVGNTPPLEKNLQNFLHQQAQFSSISHVIPQKLQPASSGTKNPNPALNYQTATNSQKNQKSPFAYPHTSKASQLVNMVNAALSGNNLQGNTSNRPQIIDQQRKRNNSGGGGGHHVKQKSMQINSVSQLGIGANIKQVRDTSNNRSGSVGHKGAGISIEPGIANKILTTKQQVDQAFEVMKKKIGEVKLMPPLPRGDPINIQPIKTISSVSTLTSQSNQVLYAGSMNSAGHHRDNSMTLSNPKQPLHGHSGPLIHHKPTQSSIPTKNTPFFGGHQSTPSGSSLTTLQAPSTLSQATDTLRSNPHIGTASYQQPQQSDIQSRSSAERVMQLHQVNMQAVQDFERNYRKLSQMLDKIFQHTPE